MTRLALAFAAVFAIGCNKPSEEDCKLAIINMSTLMGTEKAADADLQGEVRRCRGGSKKDAVACAINAKSVDALHACGFTMKARVKPGSGSDAGSGSGSGSTK